MLRGNTRFVRRRGYGCREGVYFGENDRVAQQAPDLPKPVDPITVDELVIEQQKDLFRDARRAEIDIGKPTVFWEDPHTGLLMRHAYDHPQIVVPALMQERLLSITHTPQCASHRGGRLLYTTLRRNFYWPAMVPACYRTSSRCVSCAKERIKLRRVSTPLKLFPATALVEDVELDLLGELTTTARGFKHLLVITCRFSKLTRVVPLRRITA